MGVISFISPRFVEQGLFALLFPFFILTSARARPQQIYVPRRRGSARGGGPGGPGGAGNSMNNMNINNPGSGGGMVAGNTGGQYNDSTVGQYNDSGQYNDGGNYNNNSGNTADPTATKPNTGFQIPYDAINENFRRLPIFKLVLIVTTALLSVCERRMMARSKEKARGGKSVEEKPGFLKRMVLGMFKFGDDK